MDSQDRGSAAEDRWCGEVAAHEGHEWSGAGQEYVCDGVPLGDSQEARSAATASREEWEAAYDEAMRWRDWQTCEILIEEREQADWYTPDMGCAACAGDPEAHDLHVCGKEPGE